MLRVSEKKIGDGRMKNKTVTLMLVSALFLALMASSAFASELGVEITPSLTRDTILSDNDNTTLKVRIRSQDNYQNLHINVSIPTARKLSVSPERVDIDIIGEGETRGDYDFKIKSRGQDNGSYAVHITVYDNAGNSASKKMMMYVGSEAGMLSFEIAIAIAVVLLSLGAYGFWRIKRR